MPSLSRAGIRSRHRHRRRSPREAIPDRHALPPRHRLAPRHLFRPSPAPPDRHVDSQSLESQPEGRTLCTAWQGFLSVGAEERSGAQKAAPGTPHGRYRRPPPFRAVMGTIKMGPVPTADHAATGQPGAHPPWGWENRSIFYSFERRLPQRYGGGGVKMTRYLPYQRAPRKVSIQLHAV